MNIIDSVKKEKSIVDDGVSKTYNDLLQDWKRNKFICALLVVVALFVGYKAYSWGVGGFFAYVFIVIPVSVAAFVYYAKVKRNVELLDELRGKTDKRTKMTIREYVLSKIWKIFGVAAVSWGAGFLFTIGLIENKAVPILSFFVFGGAVVANMFFVVCPRCGSNVGPFYPIIGYANYCSGCGISFDEPAKEPKDKIESDRKE